MMPAEAPLELVARIADELPFGVWVARVPSGELAYANRAFKAIMGMEARTDVAAGQYAEPYQIRDRDGAPYAEERMPFVRAMQSGHSVMVDDLVIHRPDGRKVDIRAFAEPIYESGRMILISISFIDISRERNAERDREKGSRQVETLVADLHERVNELSLLNALSLDLASTQPTAFFERALPRIMQTFEADTGVVYLERDGELTPVAQQGISPESMKRLTPLRSRRGPAGRAFETGRSVRVDGIEEVAAEDRWFMEREGVFVTLAVPLAVKRKVMGSMVISRRSKRPFSDGDAGLLEGIGAQLGLAGENRDLHEDLRWSYEALARAQTQLISRERLAALGELAAQVAHEVRNPVGAILNATASLRRKAGDQQFLMQVIEEEARRLSQMVDDLLHFSQPRLREVLRQPLAPILTAAVQAALAHATAPVTVKSELDEEIEADVDARLMREVFLNVAVNAVQAMPDGGQLTVKLTDGHGRARIEMTDTGHGIPPDLQKRIFEPFFTTKASGTGLGLAVVRRILELHQGQISVSSQPGRGATFILEVPGTRPVAPDV